VVVEESRVTAKSIFPNRCLVGLDKLVCDNELASGSEPARAVKFGVSMVRNLSA
jgi:hypothetical protein